MKKIKGLFKEEYAYIYIAIVLIVLAIISYHLATTYHSSIDVEAVETSSTLLEEDSETEDINESDENENVNVHENQNDNQDVHNIN